jgi:SNF2 family DNA or RNA helicase
MQHDEIAAGVRVRVHLPGWLARKHLVETPLEGVVISKTTKAVFVDTGTSKHWFPLSSIGIALVEQQSDAVTPDANLATYPPIPTVKSKPWNHQLRAFWQAVNIFGGIGCTSREDGFMLGLDMGTGKTKVTIDIIVNMGYDVTFIFCPKNVVDVWPREFRKHCDVKIKIVCLQGTGIQKAKQLRAAVDSAKLYREKLVVSMNYHCVFTEPLFGLLKQIGANLLVLDESHKVKSAQGSISKACAYIARTVPHRLLLTGTPMAHSPLDIFAQFRVLNPNIFGQSFVRFRNKYAKMGGYGMHQVVGYQNMDELNRQFFSRAIVVKSEDVQDLPELLEERLTFQLSPKAAEMYAEMYRESFVKVSAGEITAVNALTKLLRCQQITSGYLKFDEGSEEVLDSGKADLLEDTLDDLPVKQKIVIFCRFTADLRVIEAICKKHGRVYNELSGKRNDCKQYEMTFPPNADVLAVQIQAGGVGIDLTLAHYMFYYSLDFSLANYLQSVKRTHRPGQRHDVHVYHLVAEGTVDVKIYNALAERKQVVDYVLGLKDVTKHG